MKPINPLVAQLPNWRELMNDPLGKIAAGAKDLLLASAGEWSADIPMPDHMIEAAVASVQGRPSYTNSMGLIELREAIAEKLVQENGLRWYDPGDEILVTSSATEAACITVRALLSPGDEIIFGDPYYLGLYQGNVDMAGAKSVFVPCYADNSFRLTAEGVREAITPNTKVLVVTSPENPTGATVTPEGMEELAQIALENDLWVISDEVYEKFVYDGRKHASMACIPGMAERTITINGFSKSFGMTGYRIGYVAGPASIVRELAKIHVVTTLCASELSQRVGMAALRGPQDWLDAIVAQYGAARTAMVDGLNAIPGVTCPSPDGAIYVLPDFSAYGMTDMEMSAFLIEHARVNVRPGTYFGSQGKDRVRFNITAHLDVAQEVVRRIKEALSLLPIKG